MKLCINHSTTIFLPFQCQFYPWTLCLLHDYYCLDVSSPQVQTQLRKPVPKSQSYPSSPSWRRWWWWRRQRGRWWSSFVARYSRVIPYCSSETLHITLGFSPTTPISEPPLQQKNVSQKIMSHLSLSKYWNDLVMSNTSSLNPMHFSRAPDTSLRLMFIFQ